MVVNFIKIYKPDKPPLVCASALETLLWAPHKIQIAVVTANTIQPEEKILLRLLVGTCLEQGSAPPRATTALQLLQGLTITLSVPLPLLSLLKSVYSPVVTVGTGTDGLEHRRQEAIESTFPASWASAPATALG